MKEVLGIDIGGVIMSRLFIDGSYPPLLNVFDVIYNLKEKRFSKNIVIVSRADIYQRFQMIRWLGQQQFYKKTGVGIGQVFFCENRIDKADICQKKEVTHFIDDRKEIMTYLHRVGIKNLFLFQGRNEEGEGIYDHVLPHVVQVESWLEIKKALLE